PCGAGDCIGGLANDLDQPASHGGAETVEVAAQCVVAAHHRDGAPRGGGRYAEPVVLALDDERGDGDRVELGQPALRSARTPWRDEREGEAENACGAGRS